MWAYYSWGTFQPKADLWVTPSTDYSQVSEASGGNRHWGEETAITLVASGDPNSIDEKALKS